MESDHLPLCPNARFEINSEKDGYRPVVTANGCTGERMETSFESFGSSHTVRPLLRCNSKIRNWVELGCGCCGRVGNDYTYYFCHECDESFHRECVESPPEMNHPYHPRHQLRLFFFSESPRISCHCCRLLPPGFIYLCSICDFTMDAICAKKRPLLAIDHPKIHEHTLSLFPRQVSFTCNACALVNDDGWPVYVCLRCDFMIHRDCIYLPRVIKMSRHPHRLAYSHALPSGEPSSCGVCRREVNIEFGGYTCTKGCSNFVAHSKCATRRDVWDGKELEGVPEDADAMKDVDPFEQIGEGIICHFSHRHHHLRINEESRVYDDSRFCRACTLPVHYDGGFYSCMQCDFTLHERCANLPRKLHHPLHPHPFTLQIDNIGDWFGTGCFMCNICQRSCSGFMYQCPDEDCDFKLDVRCASISEPFSFDGHLHPLFLTSSPGTTSSCQVCRSEERKVLNCIECDFTLCIKCATLPYRIKYKHDGHLLALGYGDEASGIYWCEVCEEEVNPEGKLYTCDECCLTLHVDCVFGVDSYITPGQTIVYKSLEVETLPNNRVCRPTCKVCCRRCQHRIVFKALPSRYVFCSLDCFLDFNRI
ncbi:PREDICTED: uncharacterized protein LOC104812545 [Tarenaya hassleriana]|uniref:uncharacterized protein LOC104812545 n=1 Tax=Tarenaya hassleriana TaxID=28532 RepID=UPI00053C8797|nr:PREDICTED: uncharacterized protein LOC104812545 [Tarenaya hassleriana]